MIEKSDKELLALFLQGDNANKAFSLIVQKHQRKLYAIIRRVLIDHDDTNDVLQNTFIKAWNGLSSFREEAQLSTWLYRIASNETLSFLRQSKRDRHLSIDQLYTDSNYSVGNAIGPSAEEIEKKLHHAIQQLPEKQRLVFTMKYYEDLTYEQMSDILGTSVGALKASFHIAAKKIEEEITNGALNLSPANASNNK
ncbi:MAG TPA: RNA polymerase subunit sigma [Flavobacteriales bacterium]|nr:RNA polymerase subunit sigma [Flavobacteriales bacterium]HRE73939.1 sigma-70 family RNA polymerase sigma factor [Flavobacteriales bacterium]HRJ35208.1 sigma-70 family RNA polymerase sigma factor [Flavobacteriales bacterium]HRJ38997.1 sigma-70 family RNA polymerase sigma factor [Flavobacteriales bacterium]